MPKPQARPGCKHDRDCRSRDQCQAQPAAHKPPLLCLQAREPKGPQAAMSGLGLCISARTIRVTVAFSSSDFSRLAGGRCKCTCIAPSHSGSLYLCWGLTPTLCAARSSGSLYQHWVFMRDEYASFYPYILSSTTAGESLACWSPPSLKPLPAASGAAESVVWVQLDAAPGRQMAE